MLDVLRRGQRWWTAIVVVAVGGVFAVFIGLGGNPLKGGGGPDAVIQIGDYRVGLAEFERVRQAREEEFQEALGEAYDARAMAEAIDSAAVRLLVERTILALEAERLGLTVTKREVEREILSIPSFRDEAGAFDKEGFDRWVAWEFGSERAFLEQQRRLALAQKLLRLIRSQATVSEGEVREAVRQRLEGARIAAVVLDPTRIPADFPRDEAAIQTLLAERGDAVRKLFEERSEQFNVPERTRARHILLRVGKDAPPEEVAAVEERGRRVLERLAAGEAFAALAEELSEDPGSKAAGGDLGYFPRGQMVPAFEAVAFALEPGARSDLVRTDYGFHVILVEDRKPAEVKSFEEVRGDLAYELLGREEAERRARGTAEALAEAVRQGRSLEEAAREQELTLERSGVLQRRPDGFVPGVGASPELLATAFTLPPGQSSPRIFDVSGKLALVQVLERSEPSAEEVGAQLAAERERRQREKLERYLQTWIAQRQDELVEAEDLVVRLDAIRRG
jgi:peptidyl-prolyl cis-trans isomerase D